MGRDSPPLEALATPENWNTRYEKAETKDASGDSHVESFDWFRSFERIKPFLEKYLPAATAAPRLLHLGCGNSVSQQAYHGP